jgi:hypothetical protein
MALVKYNNNSIAAITTAGTLSASQVLIKSITASSSATVNFVDGSSDVVLDNTYPIYLFHFIDIHPATDNTKITFQGSTNTGSSYGVDITSTRFYAFHRENDATPTFEYDGSEDLAQSTSYQNASGACGNDNDHNLSGYLYLFNPSSTTFKKNFIIETNSIHGLDASLQAFTAGYFNTTSAIDAIQFKMDSGNVDAGKIKLYGIKDS